MKVLKIIAVLFFVFVLVVVGLGIYLLAPKDATSTEGQTLTVVSGERSADIAKRLENVGLIKNSFAFYVYLKLIGGKILPGTYELTSAESASDIANTLASGKFKVAKITIIEGWRVSQTEKYLVDEAKLSQMVGFAAKAGKYEGYLFPDTYEVKVDITDDELIALMRDTFIERTAGLRITPETVILASIVEREALSDDDRPPIAGVYANRVKISMRLQADPTVQYAKGSWEALEYGDTESVESPYNTYLNDGLPPGPICSPGLKSLEAAAKPATHDYLYFFHAKGQTHFSKTYAEHQAKLAQFF
ncbi:hypothetical protein A3A71_03515 [Candidatus Berkelbacteria bacterium RIFCSPLOWO2_01_FULL_50_28]|uniref:Endolytic murein transglycosylase n=1 Tax=Candidatus Berkelbacteria bacterium RIFCSPLOWO2_01_FULL_50_28 TaxID=1797471 RepID=A0A1F5ECP4_9BACT|nr:MAG: hypothetical protein A2807_03080 [Candidatus Berkelbacteria bacterium RIFCSPHIGHO2_01_FULL_50_36]OGD65123.1 MAG: hypothetical protein A3A71_03515 [Candidatus Berkelbacteria bacterium RIFCSPLOWO2_01_FULL_50_28]